jgi:hypothetical protein
MPSMPIKALHLWAFANASILQLCNPRDLGSSASCRTGCTRIYELTPFASKQYIVQVVTKIAIHVASIVEPRRTLEFTRFFHSLATPPLSSVDGTALRTGKSTKYSIHRSGHTKKTRRSSPAARLDRSVDTAAPLPTVDLAQKPSSLLSATRSHCQPFASASFRINRITENVGKHFCIRDTVFLIFARFTVKGFPPAQLCSRVRRLIRCTGQRFSSTMSPDSLPRLLAGAISYALPSIFVGFYFTSKEFVVLAGFFSIARTRRGPQRAAK